MRLLLTFSVAFNLLLAAWLGAGRLSVRRGSAGEGIASPSVRLADGHSSSAIAASRRVAAKPPSGTASTNALPDWGTLESSDYREYVSRLRAAGVPEDIVRDLIVADVRKAYGPRARNILGDGEVPHFWQKPRDTRPTPEQLHKLDRLEQEEQGVIAAVLGVRTTIQPLVDRLFLQVDPRELALEFLDPDKQEAARKALEEAGVRHHEMNEPEFAFRTDEGVERDRMRLRFDVLKGVLSRDELAAYEARLSPSNGTLRRQTRDLDLSESEYVQLVQIRDGAKSGDATSNAQGEKDAIRELLGAERYAQFENRADWTYVFAREAAKRYGMAEQVADEVLQMKRATEAAGEQLWSSDLNEEEKRRQGAELRRRAQRTLLQKLGPDGYAMVIRDAAWLQLLELARPTKP